MMNMRKVLHHRIRSEDRSTGLRSQVYMLAGRSEAWSTGMNVIIISIDRLADL